MAITKQHMQILIDADNKTGGAFDQIENDANRTLGSGKKGLGGLGKGAKLAIGGAVAGVAALGAGLVASVKTAGNFQQSMAGVQATLGPKGTAGAMEKLTSLAKEMGATTSFSASEAADGMKFLAQAGFSTDEIMSALPNTLSLAAAGGLELGEAADIASNVLSGMRMPVGELNGVVDGLAAAASNSNTSVQQMGNAFKMVAPGAAAAGVSFDDTAAALGVLADNGIQASAGGTALNAALRTMINPSKEAEAAAKKMGVTFLDTEGNVRPLTDIVADLEENNLSAKDALVMFGEEGGRAINALVGSGSKRLQELKTSIEDSGGAAERMAKVQMDTFEGAMKGLGSATEGLMITLGENFLPILQSMLENFVTPAVRKFNEWITAVGGLGQVFKDAWTLISGYMSGIFETIKNVFSDHEYRALFIGMLGDVFEGAIELVANFGINAGKVISTFAQLAWEPLKFYYLTVWNAIKAAGIEGWNVLGKLFVDGLNSIIGTVNTFGEFLGIEIGKVDFTPLTHDAPDTMDRNFGSMAENMERLLGELGDNSSQLLEDLSRDAEKLDEPIAAVVDEIVANVDEGAVAVAKSWEKGLDGVVDASADAGEEAGEALVKAATDEIATGENKDSFKRRGETSGKWFGAGLAASVTKGVRDFKMPTFGGFGKGASDKLGGFGAMFGDANKLSKGFSDKFGGVVSAGMSIMQSDNKLEAAGAALGGALGSIIGGPVGGMIGEFAGKALGKLAGVFSGTSRAESRKNVLAEIQQSIDQGDLANFRARNNLLRTLDNAGSARITAKAIQDIYGMSYSESVGLINVLASVGKHKGAHRLSDSQLRLLEQMNIQTGATASREEVEEARRRIVRSQHGFSGTVTRPTVFMAGEAGAEHVQVTPHDKSGFAGAGGIGGMNFTFNINALDVRGVENAIGNEIAPMVIDRIRAASRRGEGIMHSDGLIAERRV